MSILLDVFSLTPAQAVAYLRSKKLRISGAWTEVWREQHSRAFTVATLSKLDLLQDIRSLIDIAIDGELQPDISGEMVKRTLPFAEFKKRIIPKLKSRGWWGVEEIVNMETGEVTERKLGSVARLHTIYDTNVQTAYSAGRYRGQIEATGDLPYWQYVSIIDGSTTDRCRDLNGKVFPASDPIWNTIYPPNHWGCRSRVDALTQRAIARDNLAIDSTGGASPRPTVDAISKTETIGPRDKQRTVPVNGITWTDNTGEKHTFFPDPGWDYNPGKSTYKPALDKYDPDIAALYEEAP